MGFLAALPSVIGAAGSIFGGLFGSNASNNASKQYITALQNAQKYLSDTALPNATSQFSPYTSAGSTATATLSDLLGTPGQGLLQNYPGQFTAPTAEQASQTPGYQFQLQQGENAIQNSAAANGSLLTGRTLADLNNYAQGVASTNYQNVFNNSLTQYQQAYQQFLNNQNNQYSRLMGLGSLGLQGAQGMASAITGIGGDIASLYGQEGAAQAQGTIGSANALGSIFPGLASSALLIPGVLKSLGMLGPGQSASANPGVPA